MKIQTTMVEKNEGIQAEQTLRLSEQSIRELQEIASQAHCSLKERVHNLLKLGCRRFKVPIGLVTRIQEEQLEFSHVWAPDLNIQQGTHIPLDTSFCAVTLKAPEPIRIRNGENSEWGSHPAFKNLGFPCYFGTKLKGHHTLYGTLCFMSPTPHAEEFTEGDVDFLKLMARWLTAELDRLQGEEALKKSEAQLRQVIDLVPHFIFAKDNEGRFVLANQAVANAYGTTPDSLLGKTDHDFSSKSDEVQQFRQDDLEVIQSGKTKQIHEQITDRQGQIRYLHTTKIPFTFAKTSLPCVLGVSLDITEQQQYELELAQREQLLNLVIETEPGCVKRVGSDGTLLHMNSAGLDMVEAIGEQEVIGDSVFALVSPSHRKAFEHMHQEVLRGKEQFLQFEIIGLKGTKRWVETYAAPFKNPVTKEIEHLAVTHDITERKMIEQDVARNALAIRELLFITSDQQSTFDDKLQALLRMGCERFGLSIGLVTHLQGDTIKIIALEGEHEGLFLGAEVPLTQAYCKTVLEDSHTICIKEAGKSEWKSHPMYQAFQLESYLGTQITVTEGTFGTLCFLSSQPFSKLLTDTDQDFLKLLARWVGSEIERQQFDQALKDSEEQFRQVFENSMTGMTICGPMGQFVDVNPAFCELTGYSREELIGETYAKVTHADDLEKNLRLTGDLIEGKIPKYSLEKRYLKKNAERIWVKVTVGPLRKISRKHPVPSLLALIEDVTERKQNEAVIQHLVEGIGGETGEDFFQRLVHHLGLAIGMNYTTIGVLSPDQNSIQTLAVSINGRTSENFTYALPGTPCANVLTEGMCIYPSGVQELFPEDQLLVDLEVHSYIGVPLLNSRGMPIGILNGLSMQPFSQSERVKWIFQICAARLSGELERLEAEKALKNSESKLKAIMDGSSSVIYVKDLDGKYLLINRRYEELFHTTANDIQGKTDFEVFPPNVAEAFEKNDREVLRKGQPLLVEEVAPHGDDLHTYISNKFPLFLKDGQPYAICGISTDITERKRAETQLKESEAARTRALEERTRLSQDLHDQILQSLYAVGLIISFAKKSILDEQTDKGLRTIDHCVEQLNLAIREIRQFIQSLDQQPPAPIHFAEMVEKLNEAIAQWSTVRFTIDVDSIGVKAISPEQTQQLFFLIREAMSNTIRHSKATRGWIKLRGDDQNLRLEIGDNGVGFNPLEHTLGNGLKNMKTRVQAIKGELEFISQPQEGCRIFINLPIEEFRINGR